MDPSSPILYVLSDATAETAERTLRAALLQFRGVEPDIRIHSLVRKNQHLLALIEEAARARAMLLYTIVNPDQAQLVRDRCKELGLPSVDLIGNLMHQLTLFLGETPTGRPGIPRLTEEYFRRIEAVEFAVNHDDGQAVAQLAQAEIVLVGISRTSKTPLSTFLANKGWKVANVPIVLGLPVPRELDELDQSRIFGLTIDVATLIRIRRARLRHLNMPVDNEYARRDHIIKELEFARDIFRSHPTWTILDVSQKAVEETAALILHEMARRRREAEGA